MVKILMSIAVQNFPKHENPGKFLSICISSDSSVDPSGNQSVTLSLSDENAPVIMGRKMW